MLDSTILPWVRKKHFPGRHTGFDQNKDILRTCKMIYLACTFFFFQGPQQIGRKHIKLFAAFARNFL